MIQHTVVTKKFKKKTLEDLASIAMATRTLSGHKTNSENADQANREVLDIQGVTKSGKVNNTPAPKGWWDSP